MDNKLHISKRPDIKKNERYGIISLRVKVRTADQLDRIANEANLSRNELINIMLEYGIEHCEVINE